MSTRVLSFHYVLTNRAGEQLDTSRKGEPFQVMEGSKQILAALETELFNMKLGEKKTVQLDAAHAYGVQNEKLKIKVRRDQFPPQALKVGAMFTAGSEKAPLTFKVIKIEGEDVHLDGNHPLAGVDLIFEVEVMELREATAEEMSHGHAHGPHGHHSH